MILYNFYSILEYFQVNNTSYKNNNYILYFIISITIIFILFMILFNVIRGGNLKKELLK